MNILNILFIFASVYLYLKGNIVSDDFPRRGNITFWTFWEGITKNKDFTEKFSEKLYPFLIQNGHPYATKPGLGSGNVHLILNRSVNLHTGQFEKVSFSLKGTTTYEMFSCKNDGCIHISHMKLRSDNQITDIVLGKLIKKFTEEYLSLKRNELIEEIIN